jgi:hypothetical protein
MAVDLSLTSSSSVVLGNIFGLWPPCCHGLRHFSFYNVRMSLHIYCVWNVCATDPASCPVGIRGKLATPLEKTWSLAISSDPCRERERERERVRVRVCVHACVRACVCVCVRCKRSQQKTAKQIMPLKFSVEQ